MVAGVRATVLGWPADIARILSLRQLLSQGVLHPVEEVPSLVGCQLHDLVFLGRVEPEDAAHNSSSALREEVEREVAIFA